MGAIYDEALELKGPLPAHKGDACGCFVVTLKGRSDDADAKTKLYIQFQGNYPQEKRGVRCRLEHSARAGISPESEKLLLTTINSELDQLEEGEQCGCLVIAAAEEWLRDYLG